MDNEKQADVKLDSSEGMKAQHGCERTVPGAPSVSDEPVSDPGPAKGTKVYPVRG